MKLTENFNSSEFECNDGSKMPDSVLKNIKELAKNLQVIRNVVCAPITINSAYRNAIYNKQIGGANKSLHLVGKAADITIEGMTPKEVHTLLSDLMEEGTIAEGGLGSYNLFTHYDIRGTKTRWSL
tara:strand:- start:2952 stop:3329 length:378 start_codon:yes stop_codon:yes gene_type:complete